MTPMLSSSSLHLWRGRLDSVAPERVSFLLSGDESERAKRYLSPLVRRRFIVAGGLLRIVLGRLLDLPPDRLTFQYGADGKPALAGKPAASGLQFNLAHSDDSLLIGITHRRAIGVDIEQIRPLDDLKGMAGHYFSPGEHRALLALPDYARQDAFFTCWARKEAYIKARGEGMKISLRSFEVTVTPGGAPRLLRAEGDDPTRWTFYDAAPESGYAGAAAVHALISEIESPLWHDIEIAS